MFFFFFQAEDGIRDADVTGVQTCALPASAMRSPLSMAALGSKNRPPSENESGVVFRMPITKKRSPKASVRPPAHRSGGMGRGWGWAKKVIQASIKIRRAAGRMPAARRNNTERITPISGVGRGGQRAEIARAILLLELGGEARFGGALVFVGGARLLDRFATLADAFQAFFFHQKFELGGVERLEFQQSLRDELEHLGVIAKKIHGNIVLLHHDAFDLGVNLLGDGLAIGAVGG